MLGCSPNVIDENNVIQKIDSLDMTIFSKSGDKIYSITSPESSYDNIELKFDLKKAEDRVHILLGLSVSVENIDKVIKIIRF